jgi:hypothetical protein
MDVAGSTGKRRHSQGLGGCWTHLKFLARANTSLLLILSSKHLIMLRTTNGHSSDFVELHNLLI